MSNEKNKQNNTVLQRKAKCIAAMPNGKKIELNISSDYNYKKYQT